MSDRLQTGASAPDFVLQTHENERIRLSDFQAEKHVIVYFMRAFT